MGQRIPSHPSWHIVIVTLVAVLLAGCGPFGGQQSAGSPQGSQPQILLDLPQAGAAIGSPFDLRGRTRGLAAGSNLVYRVFDASEQVVGTGAFTATGGGQGEALFATLANYAATATGIGRVEVVDLDPASGVIQTIVSARVNLGPGGPVPPAQQTPQIQPPITATALPVAATQRILLDTPGPGTVVGSPLVITGRTAIYPQGGTLGYRVLNAAGAQIGAGTFQTFGISGGPANFTGSLNFQVPPGPTSIRAEVFDQNPATGQVVASSSVELRIGAPPPAAQAIIIETPPPGTFVASPVVITGRTTQFPFQANLAWLASDQAGRQLGSGIFAVVGSPGQPTSFNASLDFQLPPNGGAVRFEIYDQDAVTGATVARGVIDLQVAAAPPTVPTAIAPTAAIPTATVPLPMVQQIFIDTPPPGTVVGSPVVITGRTAQYPFGGQLAYRFRDTAGNQLGSGAIRTAGQPGGPGNFNAQLFFETRPGVSQIFLDVFENSPTNQVVASASIALQVSVSAGPQPPASPVPGQPQVQPPASPTPAQPQVQPPVTGPELPTPIVIDTPPAGTEVGSPVVITGRTNLFPNGGTLFWRILDPGQRVLGDGDFRVFGTPGGISQFNVTLEFRPPQSAGQITLEMFTRNPNTGEAENVTTLLMNTTAGPYPAPQPPQGP